MSWSMNEIDSMSRKAVRGAGMSWGLAEEAGKSARWLASFSLPGPEMLAAHLPRVDGAAYAQICPDGTDGQWLAAGGVLCPLATGPAITDRAVRAASGGITLGRTACPLLLLPGVASVAVLTGQAMMIGWDGAQAVVAQGRRLQIVDASRLEAADTRHVEIGPAAADPVPNRDSVYRYEMDRATAAVVGKFAHRTYAPDTPESRLSGAGAGLTDND